MRNAMTATENKDIHHSDEELDREDRTAELTLKELEDMAGGRVFRFTNIRANATSLIGSILP